MLSSGAYAQRGEVRERGGESNRSWIQETGLQPVFPAGYQCPKITSAFAATTDGGGNQRDSAIPAASMAVWISASTSAIR